MFCFSTLFLRIGVVWEEGGTALLLAKDATLVFVVK